MKLNVTGMSCQSCANHIQEKVGKLPGARSVNVNFALKTISFEGINADQVKKAVQSIGYDVEAPENEKQELLRARNSLLIALVFGLPELFFGMHWVPFHVPFSIQFVLTAIVVFLAGWDIHRRTLRQLANNSVTMDTLVSMGSLAALAEGSLLWRRGTEHAGFETASTIVMFIILGRYLEARARRSTFSATELLFETLARPVKRITANGHERVAGTLLKVGEEIFLEPGDVSPVDGVVLSGIAQINEATITGEALPKRVGPGSEVLSGVSIVDSPLTVRVTRAGRLSFVGRLLTELENAQSKPVRMQRLADQITKYFVPAVISLAAFSALAQFWLTNNPEFAFNVFLSVVLVACPCALGLAIPTALVAGLGSAASRGILFRDPATLEMVSHLTDIYFDKTGTLTQGSPHLSSIQIFGDKSKREIFQLAAALEKNSTHPLAEAIKTAALTDGLDNLAHLPEAQLVRVIAGEGIEGKIENKSVAIRRVEIEINSQSEVTGTCSDVFVDSKREARLFFVDAPRTETRPVLEELKASGFDLHVLTGDNKSSVLSLEGIFSSKLFASIQTELLPGRKRDIIMAARNNKPEGVAFVGDGINDVLALSEASVGFAVASGALAAMGSGNVILRRGILDLPLALKFGEQTYHQLKFNIGWALIYNLIMLPWAAVGKLHPLWASLAMSASSVSVVMGSLWLGMRLRMMK